MSNSSTSLRSLLSGHLRGLLVVLLVLSLGVGSTVIQVVGWATMLPTQLAQTGSVKEAVENTFDGDHACPMCALAAAKRDAEGDTPFSPERTEKKKAKTAYILCTFETFHPLRGTLRFSLPENAQPLVGLSISPDSPPPRRLS